MRNCFGAAGVIISQAMDGFLDPVKLLSHNFCTHDSFTLRFSLVTFIGNYGFATLLSRSRITFSQDGTTALMAASVRGHKAAVDAIVKHGANVDQQNLDGHTALMFAYNGRNQVM